MKSRPLSVSKNKSVRKTRDQSKTVCSEKPSSRGSLAHRKRGRKQIYRQIPSEILPLKDNMVRDAQVHAPKRRLSTHTAEKIAQALCETIFPFIYEISCSSFLISPSLLSRKSWRNHKYHQILTITIGL